MASMVAPKICTDTIESCSKIKRPKSCVDENCFRKRRAHSTAPFSRAQSSLLPLRDHFSSESRGHGGTCSLRVCSHPRPHAHASAAMILETKEKMMSSMLLPFFADFPTTSP